MLCLSLAAASLAQEKQAQPKKEHSKPLTEKELLKLDKKAFKAPSGKDFYISPLENEPYRFSIILSDGNGNAATTLVLIDRLNIFESLLLEAKKFAESAEGIGSPKPVVTRFYDKQEPEFVVDVAKTPLESRFYVTLQGLNGKVTVDVGQIKRSDKKETGILSDMLTKIQNAKAGLSQQQ